MRARGNCGGGAWVLWLLAESGLFLLLVHHAGATAHLPLGVPPGGEGDSDLRRLVAEREGETVGRVEEMETELVGGAKVAGERASLRRVAGGGRGEEMETIVGVGGEGKGNFSTGEIRQEWGYDISYERKQQQLKTLNAQGRCSALPKWLFRRWLWESAFQEGALAWVPQPGKYILMDCQHNQVSNRIACIRRHLLLAGALNRTLVVPLNTDEVAHSYDRRTFLHLPHLHRCYGPRSTIPLQQLREEVRGSANRGGRSAEERQGEEGSKVEGVVMVQQVVCPYKACNTQPWGNDFYLLPELEGVVYHNTTWTALNMPLSHLFTVSDLRSLGRVLLPSADVVMFGDFHPWRLGDNLGKDVGLPFEGSGGGSKSLVCANRLAVQPHPAVLEAALGFVQQVIWKPPSTSSSFFSSTVSSSSSSSTSFSSSPSSSSSTAFSPDDALKEGITAAADATPMLFTAAVAAAGLAKQSATEAGAAQQQGAATSRKNTGREQRQPQQYLAVHWRRGDLLSFYPQLREFLTVENSGRCIAERMAQLGNISVVFLASNADKQEVGQLKRVIWGHLPGVEIVQLPEELTGQPWAKVLEPFRFQNQALLKVFLDKAVCALADVFLGTVKSSFSVDIQRLRTGFKISTCQDEYVCAKMVEKMA
ncbi:unnamed protein product [Closterium sp. NIES-64]|nr:unnamed protein product [Closterium sp. NIES-64]CAI5978791.1 unnamed protein product [Closterium sp. NIES-64]CAI6007088.1 unnamed protein product [Closterium sp. NIES-65]CAI6007089.1 unnamed protein product [Closterium sp. NIES-65]